jgi:translation initiation factor 1 (eIF-1/SUI1)
MGIERSLVKNGIKINADVSYKTEKMLEDLGYNDKEISMDEQKQAKPSRIKNDKKLQLAREVEKFLLDKGLKEDQIRKVAASFYTLMLRRKNNKD